MLKHVSVLIIVFSACVANPVDAATFALGDSIASPGHVNGFEGDGDDITAAPFSYIEDGIKVAQINGVQIAKSYGASLGFPGQYSWYPNGGDYGYTEITLADGAAFTDVSLLTGSGWNPGAAAVYLNYSLLSDGGEVLSGSVLQTSAVFPVSFLGGGYDTIRLSATLGSPADVSDGHYQALAVDNIKAGVATLAEPSPLLLIGLGLLGVLPARRRFSWQGR